MKVIDYKILIEESGGELVEAVQSLLKEGWQPLGGVAIAVFYVDEDSESYYSYSQAMVRYE